MDKKHDNQDEQIPIAPSIWVRLVLFTGFFLQLIIAFFLYIILHTLNFFDSWGVNIALMFELLFSLLPAVSLGFLLSNFIFHHIRPIRRQLDLVNNYKQTQTLLFKLLLVTLLFIVMAGGLILLLMNLL